ncbi:MAG: lipoprotein signal peptidase [Bacteroidales bacterium]|nr:lipoprotein signal peptidase [Bacteroidales bacterium]
MKKKLFFAIILVSALVLIDQIIKVCVKTSMLLGDEIRIFSWFRIHFIENEGMAFGLSFGPKVGKILLTILRIVLIGVVIYLIRDMWKKQAKVWLNVALLMILAGAIGNTIDGLFYGLLFNDSFMQVAHFMPDGGGYAGFCMGKVVDMFYCPLFDLPTWIPVVGGEKFFQPVFNFADTCITIGVCVFIFGHLFSRTKRITQSSN